jgi:hypothetical protein
MLGYDNSQNSYDDNESQIATTQTSPIQLENIDLIHVSIA